MLKNSLFQLDSVIHTKNTMGIANEKILKAMSIYEYILMCLDFPCTSINKYWSSYF